MITMLTVGSLFCGAGGLDLGFANSGFKTIWANDINKYACATFEAWSGIDVVCENIKKILSKDIPDIDVLIGGYPCQGFSVAGARRLDDSRNSLYQEYVRILKDKQPKAFVAENVKGLLTMQNGLVFNAMLADLEDCGYVVNAKLLNAKEYGVPEDRHRVIIVGIRKDIKNRFVYPVPATHIVTIREALQGLPVPDEADICMASYSSRYMSRNRKRGWDDVSFTIPAMAKQCPLWSGSPDMIKVGKDEWKFGDGFTRRFSWQEAAAIQTFPRCMVFSGDLISKYRQIGNAVPVKLAEAVAKSLCTCIC